MMDIFMMFPGGKDKALTLSYDDGGLGDVRLVSILKKYGLKGTFNLNSGLFPSDDADLSPDDIYRRLSKRETIELFANSGMEVAIHGLTHPVMHELDRETCIHEIEADRKNLEEQFQTIVRGMAYPYGAYSSAVIECARLCGIVYARTVGSSHNFTLPSDWMLWDGTCHHKDPQLLELMDRFISGKVVGDPWLFYLWGHSYEFGEDDNWELIETFAHTMGKQENIWHATNMEIYSYIQAYRSIQRSSDGKRIHNPTAQTIWYRVNNGEGWNTRWICPGENTTIC